MKKSAPRQKRVSPYRKAEKKLSLLTLLLMIASIILFMIIGWQIVLYKQHQHLISAVKNGVVLQAPVSIKPLIMGHDATKNTAMALLLKHKWALVYISTAQCKEMCIDNLAKLLQVKKRTNNGKKTVRLILIALKNKNENNPIETLLSQQYPFISIVHVSDTPLQNFFNKLPAGTQNLNSDAIYLIDKHLNVVATYSINTSEKELMQDLKALS